MSLIEVPGFGQPVPTIAMRAALKKLSGQTPQQSLLEYAKAVRGGDFSTPWHVRKIAAALEAVERGDVNRLILALPPRAGKSELASRIFPAWYLGRDRRRRVMIGSASGELATDFGRNMRDILMSPEHIKVFPDCRVNEDSSAVERFDIKDGGGVISVGRGGQSVGRGASFLGIDDPLKNRLEADSETIRESCKRWFTQSLYTRMEPDPKTGKPGAIVVTSTRWHEDDLTGWLLREQAFMGWVVVSFPAIAEEDEEFRKEGEALWPERFPLAGLTEAKELDPAGFIAGYQQRPTAAEGGIFKRNWWGKYSGELPRFKRVFQSWDTAFKAKTSNDYSVCTTWGDTGRDLYLLDAWRGRAEFPALCVQANTIAARFTPNAVLVEDRASGQSLIQELKKTTKLPVLGRKVEMDKESRAHAVTPLVESGKVLLPAAARWLNDYLDELSSFPKGKYDDQVDSTTLALEYWRTTGSGGPLERIDVDPPPLQVV